ncbi:hypothetical protein EJ06DRAFT_75270 [Trichodelitschia bisporula]|uniref:Rhodopsin domain-containing protein n=1 Tax=Trichodelitschia bisporula TaxID=703511 RepID=A0A6G1HTL8_9PEZI|nr:hypothetical protein EJ06DRAFT_75270 [Trichodelitschia bisporula]
MRVPPLEVILAWPTPNYTNPQTQGPTLVILNAVFLAIACLFVFLRIYTRLTITKWFGLDDILILAAFVFTFAMVVVVNIGALHWGWNRHIWDIPIAWTEGSLKLAYVSKILFMLAGNCTVLSLFTFYYRLIGESSMKWFRWVLHLALAFNITTFFVFLFLQIFICIPVHAAWTFPPPADAKCMNEGPVTMAGGAVKTTVDFMVTTLPIPLVLRMKMAPSQRYAVAGLLALGYAVTAAGAIRTYYAWKVFYSTYDATWWQTPAFLACTIENDVAIICACVPALRPLLAPIFKGRFGSLFTKVKTLSKTTASKGSSFPASSGYNRTTSNAGDVEHDTVGLDTLKSSSGTKLVIQQRTSFDMHESEYKGPNDLQPVHKTNYNAF